jgi:hypothetical protein
MTPDEIMAMSKEALRFAIAQAKNFDVPNNIVRTGITSNYTTNQNLYGYSIVLPDWPNDIAAAWELVEEAQAKPDECFFGIQMTPAIPHKGKRCWHVELGTVKAYGETAPLAICRAYLMWKDTTNA